MTRVLVVGVGTMGFAHAKACAALNDNIIVGLVARNFQKWQNVTEYFADVPLYNDFYAALMAEKPEAVIISSFTDTHAEYAIKAMEAGADVFVEKPLAATIKDAGRAIATARKYGRKLYVGYILRHHDMWKKFVECSRDLGQPLHVTMNMYQHSSGQDWEYHKKIMSAGLTPLVDVGVHYADLMVQLTDGEIENIEAIGEITNSEVSIPNRISMRVSYSDGTIFDFFSGFGPEIDPNSPTLKKAVGPIGSAQITAQNLIVCNDRTHQFDDDCSEKAIVNQQKHFFDIIKKDIDLEEHYHAVALSMATVLVGEQELKY